MPTINALVDDFALPELDTSKWAVTSGTNSIASPSGLVFPIPGSGSDSIESVDYYALANSSIYWQNDFRNAIRNGYSTMGVKNSVGAEFGFIAHSRDSQFDAQVDEVTGTNPGRIKVNNAGWTANEWVDSIVGMLSSEYRIIANTADELILDSPFIDEPSVGQGFAVTRAEIKLYSKTSGGAYTYHHVFTWNDTNFRWLKLTHQNNRLYWYTSRDGINWTLRDFRITGSSEVTNVKFFTTFEKIGSIATTSPEKLIINYVNTRKQLYRGSGYLTTDFNLMPIRNLVANKQWDVLKETSGTNARIGSDHTLTLHSSTVRSNLRSLIRDIDFRFDVKLATTSATVFWRANDAVTSYIGLKILPTKVELHSVVGGTDTLVDSFDITNTAGVTYSYRVIHAGGTVVVYRNSGDLASTGIVTFPVELFRHTGVSAVNTKGHVGILASTADVSTDNWIIRAGVVPPAATGSTAGAYGTIPLPDEFPFNGANFVGRIESMRLVEAGYNDLILWPTPALDARYGGFVVSDYDLGFPEFRTYTEDLSSISGTNNYTSTHGAKTISMSVAVVPGIDTTVNSLSDIFARWCAPHRRPVLLYKPVGQPERYVNLVPSPLGRPTPVDQHDYYTILTASWVVPSGVEEDRVAKQVTINSTVADTTTLVTEGTAISMPKIRIFGPATDPVIYNDTLDSASGNARLGITGTIESGEFLELDTRTRTVRYMSSDDPSANRRSMLTTKGWWGLVPFENQIRYEDLDGTGTVVIEYKDAWL